MTRTQQERAAELVRQAEEAAERIADMYRERAERYEQRVEIAGGKVVIHEN